MNNNSSLKEYYVKIQQLYANAVNMLTAINQSFNSNSSEITINYIDTDDVTQSVRIPSFLYLENKIEQIESNMSNLIKMPKSGEAWFSKAANMYKLQLVKSNCAPAIPQFSADDLYAQTKDTNILKDMVNPKTYLKINIDNLPDNIDKVMMKKIVLFTQDLYDSVANADLKSYEDYVAFLYNLTRGKDYEEYDSEISLPVRRDEYKSDFKILDVPSDDEEINPYTNTDGNLVWRIKLDTLTYTDQEDSAIEYMLHQGQYLTLDDDYAIYKVLSTNTYTDATETKSHEVILEEVVGHIQLQTTDENSAMRFHLYNSNYDQWHYVEIPLEENQYVVIFLSTVWNNIRSSLSSPVLLNLAEVMMKDKDGNAILKNGKEVSYIDYYNEYCKNIGDLLLGISDVAYSQLSNYSTDELQELQDGTVIQTYVSETIGNDILQVQRINTHLIDDQYSDQLVNLHSKKNELSSKLRAIEDNIDDTYTQLLNTSSNDTNLNVQTIKTQLDSYYTERIKLQKEIISIVDNINVIKTNVYGTADAKYRIRGNASVDNIESYIKENYVNCAIVGLQYEYKYKSITKDTTNVTNINSSIFTEWNRVTNEDKERLLEFDDINNTYTIKYIDYSATQNIVKWNQIDIPITQGEDVVVRVRYKYSVGQPFINLYSPWSDELTIEYPVEFNDTLEINSIIEQNDNDTIQAAFNKTLINDGYEEHISNKIVDNNQTFFHMPENIYSGFTTAENKFISLKDKLQQMANDLDSYKELFDTENMSQYKVYLEWENNSIELSSNTSNNIVINDTANIQLTDSENFMKKNMNIVIRNTGTIPLKLYSIFPGNTSVGLFQCTKPYNEDISKYERVPLLYGESSSVKDCLYVQRLGQWAYFREDDPYTQVSSYRFDDSICGQQDKNDDAAIKDEGSFIMSNGNFVVMSADNSSTLIQSTSQLALPHRQRNSTNTDLESCYPKLSVENYIYKFDKNDLAYKNQFILKYENIWVADPKNSNDGAIPLSIDNKDYTISSIISSNSTLLNFNTKNTTDGLSKNMLCGGFFIPQLLSDKYLLCNNDQYYKQLAVGESISIPLIFEYYLNSQIKSVQKILHLDLKTKLTSDVVHYGISMKAVYEYENRTNASD